MGNQVRVTFLTLNTMLFTNTLGPASNEFGYNEHFLSEKNTSVLNLV